MSGRPDHDAGPATGLRAHLVVERDDGTGIDVRLDAPTGRTTALLGPNGAGKSTAIAALAGLVPLADGIVELDGRVLDDPGAGVAVAPEARRLGVVFQDRRLFAHLTVRENVAFARRSRGASRGAARTHADGWLARFGLSDLADRRPDRLSGGQAQRVAVCRALAADPEALLLDEPLAALDVTTRQRMRRLLADHLAAFPGPRLLITHDPIEAFLLADRIHVVERGRTTQTGTADDLRLHPRTDYVADLVGTNLLRGIAHGGTVDVDGHALTVADTAIRGPVLVTVHPRAVSLHPDRPAGSPRNTWRTRIGAVDHLGDRVRLQVEGPLPLTVEITEGSFGALRLERDAPVWAALKATEIVVRPDR